MWPSPRAFTQPHAAILRLYGTIIEPRRTPIKLFVRVGSKTHPGTARRSSESWYGVRGFQAPARAKRKNPQATVWSLSLIASFVRIHACLLLAVHPAARIHTTDPRARSKTAAVRIDCIDSWTAAEDAAEAEAAAAAEAEAAAVAGRPR